MKYIICFAVASSLIFLWFSRDIEIHNAPRNSIFLHDVDGVLSTYMAEEESNNACSVMVENVCQALFTSRPSQELFNKLLKKIYTAPTDTSPDILNLQGRLFWYKIELDRQEKIYPSLWIERWKICAKQSWRDAAQGYKEEPSLFCLYIQDWMPEKRLLSNQQNTDFICGDNEKSMEYLLHKAFAE